MQLSEVKRWVEQMRRLGEADIPYLVVDGQYFTPNQILREAEGNTAIWKKIQEQLGDPPLQLSWNLLEKRIEERYRQGRIPKLYKMHRVITPEEQVQAVRERTIEGYKILLAEAKLLEELERRRKGEK